MLCAIASKKERVKPTGPVLGGMSPVEIKVKLLRLHITQQWVANELGVSVAAVNQVIHDKNRSNRIEKYLEELLKKADEGEGR